MVNKIKNTIADKYYQYQPGEFLPVFSGGQLINKKDFHVYKLRRAIKTTAHVLQAARS